MTAMERERKRRDWTQTHLAFVVGVHQSQISAFERGKSVPTDAQREVIARVLSLEPGALLDSEPDSVEAS